MGAGGLREAGYLKGAGAGRNEKNFATLAQYFAIGKAHGGENCYGSGREPGVQGASQSSSYIFFCSLVLEAMSIPRLCVAWRGVQWMTPYTPVDGDSKFSAMRSTAVSRQTLMLKQANRKPPRSTWIFLMAILMVMECLKKMKFLTKQWKWRHQNRFKRLYLLAWKQIAPLRQLPASRNLCVNETAVILT